MVRYDNKDNDRFSVAMRAIFHCLFFYRLKTNEILPETSTVLFNNKITYVCVVDL